MRAKSLTLGKLYFCGLLVELIVIKIIVLENYVMIWEVLLKCVCGMFPNSSVCSHRKARRGKAKC